MRSETNTESISRRLGLGRTTSIEIRVAKEFILRSSGTIDSEGAVAFSAGLFKALSKASSIVEAEDFINGKVVKGGLGKSLEYLASQKRTDEAKNIEIFLASRGSERALTSQVSQSSEMKERPGQAATPWERVSYYSSSIGGDDLLSQQNAILEEEIERYARKELRSELKIKVVTRKIANLQKKIENFSVLRESEFAAKKLAALEAKVAGIKKLRPQKKFLTCSENILLFSRRNESRVSTLTQTERSPVPRDIQILPRLFENAKEILTPPAQNLLLPSQPLLIEESSEIKTPNLPDLKPLLTVSGQFGLLLQPQAKPVEYQSSRTLHRNTSMASQLSITDIKEEARNLHFLLEEQERTQGSETQAFLRALNEAEERTEAAISSQRLTQARVIALTTQYEELRCILDSVHRLVADVAPPQDLDARHSPREVVTALKTKLELYEQAIKLLENEIEDLQRDNLTRGARTNPSSLRKLSLLEEEFSSLNLEKESLKEKADLVDEKQARVEQLIRENNELKTSLQKLSNQKPSLSDLQAQLAAEKSANDSLRKDLASAESEKMKLEEHLFFLQARGAKKHPQMDLQLQSIQQENHSANKEKKRLQEELLSRNRLIKDYERRLTELKVQLDPMSLIASDAVSNNLRPFQRKPQEQNSQDVLED